MTRLTDPKSWLRGLLLGLAVLASAVSASADPSGSAKVATLTPITHSIGEALLRGTDTQVVFLPPSRLPVNRVPSWLRRQRTNSFEPFSALISISDAVPELSFETTLRQANIRLVTIDVAYARLPEGERVVLRDPSEFFWLNSDNLLLMLGILKRDLVRLWPEKRPRIDENYQSVSRAIRRYAADTEALLIEHDIAGLAFNNEQLTPLAHSLSMEILTPSEAIDFGLPTIAVARKPRSRSVESPQPATGSLPLWAVDDFSRFSAKPLEARLQENLQALLAAFGP